MLQRIVAISFLALSTNVIAADHHFFVQMENISQKDVTLSFRQVEGNVSLSPILEDGTKLSINQKSVPYAVSIVPLDPKANYNIIFKGEKDCQFNVGFYAAGRPRVTMQGLGCLGSGAKITNQGTTLLLYVSDINRK